jgi:aminoglycoside phosphotransferase
MKIEPSVQALPGPIAQALKDTSTDGLSIKTDSASEVYRYVSDATGRGSYLKIQPPSWSPPLSRERDAMGWFYGKVTVPEIIVYHRENDVEYLLTTAIPGQSSENESCHANKQHLVEQLADALHTIHNIPTTACPIDKTPDGLIAHGRARIEAGIITQKMVEDEGMAGSPTEALDGLAEKAHELEGPVMTHGDYCLPNIMIENDQVSGFIDLGYFGIGDPYRDYIAAQYSVRRNLGEEWIAPFFHAYGLKSLDEQKLRWYRQIQAFD